MSSLGDRTVPPARARVWQRALDLLERAGNRLPDPVVLFVALAVLVLLASALFSSGGARLEHPVTGEPVTAVNLLAWDRLGRIFTEAVPNFVTFPPLGTVLVALMGIGLADRSGLIPALLKILVSRVPGSLLSGALVFAGVISSVAADAGFVILPPLGALLFARVGRHPVAGLCAAFSGVSAAHSANLLLTPLDAMQAGFTQAAAQLVDPGYTVSPAANYYLMAVSVFVVTAAAWYVTDRIVEPRLGRWEPAGGEGGGVEAGASPRERSAMVAAVLTFAVLVLALVTLVVPENAPLRTADGALTPLYRSLVVVMAVALGVPGIVFGLVARTIRRVGDVPRMMSDTLGTMGSYLVLTFFAAQFVAYFSGSNLGLMLGIAGGQVLQGLGVPDAILMLTLVAMSAGLNVVMVSANAKWALLAPVVVPMMMSLGLSPELAQAAFRIGDSSTNVISPLLPYFPIIIVLAQKYDPTIRLGSLIALMIPYALVLGVLWSALLVVWYALGLPLGPGAPLHYQPSTLAAG
jgi:aminobenzoyl-glutamate transport protein